jgi:hypothetical protein
LGDEQNKVQIANALDVTESVVSTRLTAIYKKFGITDPGPVKEGLLRRKLEKDLHKYQLSSPVSGSMSDSNKAVGALAEQVRLLLIPLIQHRCGTMRVLDMPQPVGLDKIYTHVNILEKITGRGRRHQKPSSLPYRRLNNSF